MSKLAAGQVLKIRYVDQFPYTFDVEVTAIGDSDEFTGRVKRIFAADDGEITGGDILRAGRSKRRYLRKLTSSACSCSPLRP